MNILHDKYAMTALAAIAIVFIICLTNTVPEPSTDTEISGVTSDLKKTENGYTFTITDGSGENTKCYYTQEVPNGTVCSVSGRFSDDGTMLFVSVFREIV